MHVIALETMPDHIHILFEAMPQINLAEFVNAYKSASSRRMRTDFRETLSKTYWKPYFWSLSYYIGTVSEKNTSVVKEYIQTEEKG